MNNEQHVVAVDVGGTNVRSVLFGPGMTVVAEAARALERSSVPAMLECMATCVEEVFDRNEQPEYVGVAMKGFVDPEGGSLVESANLGMGDVPIKAFIEERFHAVCYVENDLHAQALGELHYGAGREYRNLVFVNVGTGVGVGLVLDGRLYRGAMNFSGEFGHVSVDYDGVACHCGLHGCVEELVSGPAIATRYRQLAGVDGSMEIDTKTVFQLAQEGAEPASRVIDESVLCLGTAIVGLVNLLNPDAVVFGGGVFSNNPSFAGRLEEFIRGRSMAQTARSLRFVGVSRLGATRAGLFGAAALAAEHRGGQKPA